MEEPIKPPPMTITSAVRDGLDEKAIMGSVSLLHCGSADLWVGRCRSADL
jgi:hypothetical protein